MQAAIGSNNADFKFQSAPGREAGRCNRGMMLETGDKSFNPRPAVRPGDALLIASVV